MPFISVDTKKKELAGNFKNAGVEWQPKDEPELVDVHDFPGDAIGKASPYRCHLALAKLRAISAQPKPYYEPSEARRTCRLYGVGLSDPDPAAGGAEGPVHRLVRGRSRERAARRTTRAGISGGAC